MVRQTFQVPGVSCQNCVRHVTEELEKIPGVQNVVVDLDRKTVTVDHDGAVTDPQIRAGIEEAGYEVAA
jgi:copper ion binding protein